MGDVAVHGANTTLSYMVNGVSNTAALRCPRITINYGLNADESHARRVRAFYPHRRSQGGFALTFDCKGFREYRDAMSWFQDYSNAVLDPNVVVPYPVRVTLKARDFDRWGIPTTGMEFGDHTASMVFSPMITFISVADPTDPSANILRLIDSKEGNAQDSVTSEVKGSMSSMYFYPDSMVNTPGKIEDYLYSIGELGPPGIPNLPHQVYHPPGGGSALLD